jgi:hypothetical protein
MAGALHWMRHRIRNSVEEKPDLQRALPILDVHLNVILESPESDYDIAG